MMDSFDGERDEGKVFAIRNTTRLPRVKANSVSRRNVGDRNNSALHRVQNAAHSVFRDIRRYRASHSLQAISFCPIRFTPVIESGEEEA